jgi:lipopolysaccharide biosynthesis glycosyltransferase
VLSALDTALGEEVAWVATANVFPLIVMGCDERYAFPLAVTILSALRASKTPLRIVVLGDKISSRAKGMLSKIAARYAAKSFEIIDVDLQDFSKHYPGSPHLSAAAFSRLLIPGLLPAEDRCIWLDSDLLIHRDLQELWDVDLHGKPVGAVQCYHVSSVGAPHGIPYVEQAKASPLLPYFNSGIMLLDLNAWRRDGIDSQINDFLRQYGNRLNAADQDALNGVLMNRWHSLPGYWNDQQAANRKPKSARLEMKIRHFSGPQKPWNSGLFDQDCKQWLRCAAETGYYAPLRFVFWRLRRFDSVMRDSASNWLRSRGWMR